MDVDWGKNIILNLSDQHQYSDIISRVCVYTLLVLIFAYFFRFLAPEDHRGSHRSRALMRRGEIQLLDFSFAGGYSPVYEHLLIHLLQFVFIVLFNC